jgi:hypothetical protein
MGEIDPRKSKRGRPKSKVRSALIASQIVRVDALARREASRVRAMLSRYISLEAATAAWAAEKTQARNIISDRYASAPPDVLAAALSGGLFGVEQALKTLAFTTLRALASAPPASRPVPRRDPLLVPPPATFKASTSLAAARGRLARLQAQRMDLVGRVVPNHQAEAELRAAERRA